MIIYTRRGDLGTIPMPKRLCAAAQFMAQRFGPEVADSYINIVGWPSLRAEIEELIGMGLIERARQR